MYNSGTNRKAPAQNPEHPTSLQNLLLGPEPAPFPEHSVNSDMPIPTPLSPQQVFPKSVLGPSGDLDPSSAIKELKAMG